MPGRLPPTGAKVVAPASSEMAVVPATPSAVTRVGDANAAALIGVWAGVTSVPVTPPSAVRTSWVVAVAMTQVDAAAQETSVRFCGAGSARPFALHVRPPVVVVANSD